MNIFKLFKTTTTETAYGYTVTHPAILTNDMIDELAAEAFKIGILAGNWEISDLINEVKNPTFRKLKAGETVVRRNKKVDVPTEAWQKNVERKLEQLANGIMELKYGNFEYAEADIIVMPGSDNVMGQLGQNENGQYLQGEGAEFPKELLKLPVIKVWDKILEESGHKPQRLVFLDKDLTKFHQE